MARDFVKNVSNYMSFGQGVFGALFNGAGAVSIAARMTADTYTAGTNLNLLLAWEIGNAITGGLLSINGTTSVIQLGGRSVSTDSFQQMVGTTALTTGTEWHVGGVMNIAGDTITPYVNGVAEGGGGVTFGNATYTHTASGVSQSDRIGTTFGTSNISTSNQFDGRIAEVAFWTADIGAAGFAMLASGFSPLFVAPESLIFYCPLLGAYSPERDVVNGKSGTITGTLAAAAHPRVFMPVPRPVRRWASGAVAAAVAVSHRRTLTGVGR